MIAGKTLVQPSGANSKTQRPFLLVETRIRHGTRSVGSIGETTDGFEAQPCKERYHPIVIVASSASRSTLRAGFSHAFPVVLPVLAHAGSSGDFPKMTPSIALLLSCPPEHAPGPEESSV